MNFSRWSNCINSRKAEADDIGDTFHKQAHLLPITCNEDNDDVSTLYRYISIGSIDILSLFCVRNLLHRISLGFLQSDRSNKKRIVK